MLWVFIQYNIQSSWLRVEDEKGKVVDNHHVDIFLYTHNSSLANGQVEINHCSALKNDVF